MDDKLKKSSVSDIVTLDDGQKVEIILKQQCVIFIKNGKIEIELSLSNNSNKWINPKQDIFLKLYKQMMELNGTDMTKLLQ